jgi:ABC-type glycerol-3-phosphate transport system permease component
LVTLMLLTVGAFMALPLAYAIAQALKPMNELFIFPPRFFVIHPTLNNFKILFSLTSELWVPITRYLFNSILVSVIVTVGTVLLSSMAAYPLSKHEFVGKKTLFQVIMLALLFTGETMAIPQYVVMAKLGMVNTYFALILPPLASSLGLFLMKQFMDNLPDAFMESARIDGASELRIWWSIVMPNVKPAWLTLAILGFQSIWNSTGGNMIYSEQLKLLPSAFGQIAAGGIARTGAAAAAALIMMVPPIVAFMITQSNVIQTMSHSGIKE